MDAGACAAPLGVAGSSLRRGAAAAHGGSAAQKAGGAEPTVRWRREMRTAGLCAGWRRLPGRAWRVGRRCHAASRGPQRAYEYLICGEPDAATTQERRCMIGGALCALCERVTFVVTGVLVCVTCAGGVPLPGRAL